MVGWRLICLDADVKSAPRVELLLSATTGGLEPFGVGDGELISYDGRE
jgi:hypothetical protein